jgi:hypothetical protein
MLSACKSKSETTEEITDTSEWITLFDGTSTEGWSGYKSDTFPNKWVIIDSLLTLDTLAGAEGTPRVGGNLIYTKEEFENFELYLEWKLPAGGNSGIFYHVKKGYNQPYEVGPEYQLLDDLNYGIIHNEIVKYSQLTGSDYDMYPADSTVKVLNPIGEWNTSTIKFTPELVEYYLNDVRVVSFVPWSDDWKAKKEVSKWKDMVDYGKFPSGYIGLQDHDSPIWFRNIKIKKL